MSFDEHEAAGGTPIECYRFGSGAQTLRYTSAEVSITLPALGTFVPASIVRDALAYNPEDVSGLLKLTVPRLFPPIAGFQAYAPNARIPVVLLQAHRGDEASWIVPFRGRITAVIWDGGLATVECSSISQDFARRIPRLSYQRQCNLELYGERCGVARLRTQFEQYASVIEVNGLDLVATEFSMHPTGWFNGGWVDWGGERRFITDHAANVVTLVSAIPGLAVGSRVIVYAGCDHTEATCKDKFNNLDNHLGFARVPWRDPHVYRVT